jgi:hypothetical protein
MYITCSMKTGTVKISTLKSGRHWTQASLDVMTMREKTTIGLVTTGQKTNGTRQKMDPTPTTKPP